MRLAATAVPLLAWTRIALSAGVMFLWSLTQITSPFELEPHAVDGPLIATKVCEFLAFMGVMAYLGHLYEFKVAKTFVSKILATSLLLALLVGFSAWGVAHVAEAMFPDLGYVEKHQSIR